MKERLSHGQRRTVRQLLGRIRRARRRDILHGQQPVTRERVVDALKSGLKISQILSDHVTVQARRVMKRRCEICEQVTDHHLDGTCTTKHVSKHCGVCDKTTLRSGTTGHCLEPGHPERRRQAKYQQHTGEIGLRFLRLFPG